MNGHAADAGKRALGWGRALVAGLGGEASMMVIVGITMMATGGNQATLNIVALMAGFLLLLAWGHWAARATPGRHVQQGAAAGLCAVLVYYAFRAAAATVIWAAAIDTNISDRDFMTSLTPAFILANALKIAGGAFGGWLSGRKTGR